MDGENGDEAQRRLAGDRYEQLSCNGPCLPRFCFLFSFSHTSLSLLSLIFFPLCMCMPVWVSLFPAIFYLLLLLSFSFVSISLKHAAAAICNSPDTAGPHLGQRLERHEVEHGRDGPLAARLVVRRQRLQLLVFTKAHHDKDAPVGVVVLRHR